MVGPGLTKVVVVNVWYSSLPCFRCGEDTGCDGFPYLNLDELEVSFCAPCATRLFDMMQAWIAATRVVA